MKRLIIYLGITAIILVMMAAGRSSHQREIDVWIQDQTTPPYQFYLMRHDKVDITLTSAIEVGDDTISVSAGHGFTADGDTQYVYIREGDLYTQSQIVAVDGNDIVIKTAVVSSFSTDATVVRGVIDLNIGNADELYQMNMFDANTPVDIQTIMISMICGGQPTVALFGDQTELEKGLNFYMQNSVNIPYGNYSRNLDFLEFGAEVKDYDNTGFFGADYGFTALFDVKKYYGVVIRVNPRLDDIFKAEKQDDLTGLESCRISLMGQYTLGE